LVVLFLSLCSCEGRFCFSTLPISSHRCVSFGHFVALFVSRRWVEVYITSPQTQGSLLGNFRPIPAFCLFLGSNRHTKRLFFLFFPLKMAQIGAKILNPQRKIEVESIRPEVATDQITCKTNSVLG
jgi:hypothetical protein